MSGRHAQIEVEDEMVWLTDLDSSNGTWVNGDRLLKRIQLEHGDQISFADLQFVFAAEGLLGKPPDDEAAGRTAVFTHEEMKALLSGVDAKRESEAPVADAQVAMPADSDRAERPAEAVGTEVDTWNRPQGDPEADGTTEMGAQEANFLRFSLRPPGRVSIKDPHLLVLSGQHEGTIVGFPDNTDGTWTIGGEGRSIVLLDPEISLHHATLRRKGLGKEQKWSLVDHHSHNGVWVNNERRIAAYLASEDIVQFGSVTCIFRLPTDPKSDNKCNAQAIKLATLSFSVVSLLAAAAYYFFLR